MNGGQPCSFGKERAYFSACLFGRSYHAIPASCAAGGRTNFNLACVLGDQVGLPRIRLHCFYTFGGLFGFHNEAITSVQVDFARSTATIVMLEINTPFEDVIVGFVKFL